MEDLRTGAAGVCVLLVDDSADVRGALERILISRGASCLSFGCARAALDEVDLAEVDAIVCDVRMPGMTGLDLLREVRERDSRLPFLLMTGDLETETLEAAMRLGATDVIQKPMGVRALWEAITNAVERS